MTVNFDPTNDYQVVDNLETITYYVKISDGVYDSGTTITNCFRRAQGQSLDDYSQVNSLTWHIWKANAPANFTPKSQDKLYAASDQTTWIVGDVDFATWVTRFRLPCKKLVS